MGPAFPYTYISCPCSDTVDEDDDSGHPPESRFQSQFSIDEQPNQAPFDPHHPRSNFSLFPPEHLLYCDECRDIKCPRCIIEEQVCYFCTTCLFETPSSAVRSEGNRCARNCFNCPICFSQLSVNSMGEMAKYGPWILNCNYCMWTSLEIGIKFDRQTNIRAQLDKLANGGEPRASLKPPEVTELARRSSYFGGEPYPRTSVTADELSKPPKGSSVEAPSDPAFRFTALKSFYKDQLVTTTAQDSSLSSISGDFSSYSSPASLVRIMNLYSTSRTIQPNQKAKTPIMREALYASEGLLLPNSSTASVVQSKILSDGFSNTTSIKQRNFQTGPGGGNPRAHFVDELRPMPAPLTTKRAKRCKECRHILVKPELKPTSTRCRIRLTALSWIPDVALKPFPASNTPALSGPSVILGSDVVLEPGKPTQWILTLRNPLFDPVRMSLATPAVTPGRFRHRVTILCPQFEVGASGDVWDEALNSKEGIATGAKSPGGGGAAEAGKVYAKGRNWTSVVVEVVPVTITTTVKSTETSEDGGNDEGERTEEDEGVLEIPVRVHLEWKQGDLDTEERKARLNEEAADDGTRELAYWMILGVGRVKT